MVALVVKSREAQREHCGCVLLEKIVEVSSYPPSEEKEEGQ
jgi:hypothetical protein